jgi:hypothetical protein
MSCVNIDLSTIPVFSILNFFLKQFENRVKAFTRQKIDDKNNCCLNYDLYLHLLWVKSLLSKDLLEFALVMEIVSI